MIQIVKQGELFTRRLWHQYHWRFLVMHRVVRLGLLAGLAVFLQCGFASAQKSASGYHIIKQIKLGGDGGWDYLSFDAKNGHLFISRSTHVMIVDVNTGSVVGDIPDTSGVHGVAFVDDLNKGYTSNGRTSTVTVFDL